MLSFALLLTLETPTIALVGDPALVRRETARWRSAHWHEHW